MNVKQGNVEINGAKFVCSYGESLDGKRFYFVAGGELPNGVRIATSDVAEALNQTNGVIKTLGLIDKDGNILVPLANKSVNTIDSTYIIFEKNNPHIEEVVNLEAIKADPAASAKFAENTKLIKDKMREVAGENAVEVYSNPEGAASIYDLDGKSIVDGKYYNYIIKGMKGFAFATSKTGEIKSVGENTVVPDTAAVVEETPKPDVTPVVQFEEKKEEVIPTVEEKSTVIQQQQTPVEIEPDDVKEETEENGTSIPKEEPPREKTEKDKVLDEAIEVVKKQQRKIKDLTKIIREQVKTIDEKNKEEESLNRTITDQAKIISTLESDKHGLEIENAKINTGIISLKDVVKDAIEVLEDNDIEEVYIKTKKVD